MAGEFANNAKEFVEMIENIGPNPLRRRMKDEGGDS
jgi:coenzyme F420-reducing hydrogenase delta subunit